MAFTTAPMEPVTPFQSNIVQDQLDLPSKEYIGYDPKGTTTVTGSPIVRKDAGQQDTIEKAEEPPAQQEESITLSPQLTALARKEQAQRKREQSLAQREKALEAKLADAEKYSQLKTKLAAKDYSAADELGMTYEEYTQYLLNKQASEDPNQARVRQLEERIAQSEKAQEERVLQEYNQNQALWKQEISKIVKDSDDFSTIRELEAEGIVLQHVNDSFEEDGIELTAEEAAKQIEEELIKRAEKFASVTKIKNRTQDTPRALGPPKSSPKTITQNMTVTSQKPSSKPLHQMSESEQIAYAMAKVQAEKLARYGR